MVKRWQFKIAAFFYKSVSGIKFTIALKEKNLRESERIQVSYPRWMVDINPGYKQRDSNEAVNKKLPTLIYIKRRCFSINLFKFHPSPLAFLTWNETKIE